MTCLCGHKVFAGPSACVLEKGHEGEHMYGDYQHALGIAAAKELKTLREQVKMLRDALNFIAVDDCGCGVPCDCYSWAVMSDKARKALAATEPKP